MEITKLSTTLIFYKIKISTFFTNKILTLKVYLALFPTVKTRLFNVVKVIIFINEIIRYINNLIYNA